MYKYLIENQQRVKPINRKRKRKKKGRGWGEGRNQDNVRLISDDAHERDCIPSSKTIATKDSGREHASSLTQCKLYAWGALTRETHSVDWNLAFHIRHLCPTMTPTHVSWPPNLYSVSLPSEHIIFIAKWARTDVNIILLMFGWVSFSACFIDWRPYALPRTFRLGCMCELFI